MRKVRVDLGQRSYDICIGHNILAGLAKHINSLSIGKKGALTFNCSSADSRKRSWVMGTPLGYLVVPPV